MTAAPIRASAPVRFARILVATDFSTCSEHALTYAVAFAIGHQSHLYVLHALHADDPVRESDQGPGIIDSGRWSAEKQLRKLANSKLLAAIPHEQLLKRGRLWEVVDRFVRSQDIDLIVIGSRGRRGLEKVLIGSHSEDICRHAPCPVLVVGPHAKAVPADFLLRRILFATAYHSGSLHALAYAHSLAERYEAELILFHALRADEFSSASADSLLAQTREQLRHLAPEPARLPIRAMAQTCHSAAAAILNVAQEQAANLIVLGAQARSIALATHMPWSTAHRVICDASCPVLTVAG